jgi:VCBS repeat-containing protein
MTYDLGSSVALGGSHVWNYNEAANLNAGAQAVEIYVSPTTNTGDLVKLDNAGGDWVFPQAPGTAGYAGFDIDFGGVTNAALMADTRLVRFNILSSYGSGASLVGLSEVQFSASANFTITSVTPNTDGGLGGSVTNNGTDVTYNPNGQFNALNEGQTATDTFSYTVTGGGSVTVTITITGVSRGTVVRIR